MFLLSFLVILRLFAATTIYAQQSYSGNDVLNCNNTDDTGPSPSFLYTCNGEKHSCQAFLIFRSQPNYNSAITISNLTSSDAQRLAEINNISTSEILSVEREIIVPVECSCSGQYYQANASYTIFSAIDTYFIIANNTYQGLSTCDSLIRENPYGILDLKIGMTLKIPLRCACPAKDHINQGIKFMLTYLITWGDKIPELSKRFNVTSRSVADANGFSEEDPTLYPFTTILIPLPREPLSSQTRSYYPPVATAGAAPPSLENAPTQTKKSRKGVYIGVAIGCFLGVIFCSLFLFIFFNRKLRIDTGPTKIKDRKKMSQLQTKIADIDQVLKIYAFDELDAATENFCPQRRLGDCVYRGVVRGKLSAIKRMSNGVSKEIEIFSNISHFNLICLYGACEDNGVYYLVYEFMENGSLKEWLKQEDTCPETQSWNHRICIALDVANGLDYLHNFTSPGYVHNHINSSNILLNRNLRAKIANCGLSRLAGTEENGNLSSRMVQEMKGYMAPEYLQSGKVTPKVDVFAFGVILFQLITGREAILKQDGEKVVLLSETLTSAKNGEATLGDLIDRRLQVSHPQGFIIDQTEVTVRLVNLSAACMEHDPANRPSMAKVVSSLMKIQSDIYKPESISMEYASRNCSVEL